MKGLLVLTEARSGSNWLCSLLRLSGRLGDPGEWLDLGLLGHKPSDVDQFFQAAIARGSSANGRFGVKLFPGHLRRAHAQFGTDFLRYCQEKHEISLVRLCRRDRLRQSISLARGIMTNQWKHDAPKTGEEAYDFQAICQAYFHIESSEAFWNAYLGMLGAPHDTFVYEDLLDDPQPFVDAAARHLEVDPPLDLKTDMVVQRDAKTEEWLARFREDASRNNLLIDGPTGRPASRTIGNFARFLQKKPLLPF